MSRTFSVALLALLSGVVAIGQNVSMQPGRRPTPQPQQEQPKLSIDEKLMYICKQLDLDEKQWQHADGLFEIFQSNKNPSREEMLERLQEIQRVYQEKEAAKAAGETERRRFLRGTLVGDGVPALPGVALLSLVAGLLAAGARRVVRRRDGAAGLDR